NIRGYYNYPWNCVLRYGGTESSGNNVTSNGKYTVQKNDSLWALAEKLMGNGNLYPQIMAANNLTTTWIYPGMELVIPGLKTAEEETAMGEKNMPELKSGDKGLAVKVLQRMLMYKGYTLPKYGADGDFGAETDAAVRKLQKAKNLTVDGIAGSKTWTALAG
ncbi:MAG: peptidoglycan-binding protein, partial [Clostridia bacterium]